MWIDPFTLVFVLISIAFVFIAKIILLTKMTKNQVRTSKLKSSLISILSILIPLDIILIWLWTIGADFWNDVIHLLHNIFNLFFSTMFERGPRAGAWISITVGQLAVAFLALTSSIMLFLVLLKIFKRKFLSDKN